LRSGTPTAFINTQKSSKHFFLWTT
jgi:hypothetical protein